MVRTYRKEASPWQSDTVALPRTTGTSITTPVDAVAIVVGTAGRRTGTRCRRLDTAVDRQRLFLMSAVTFAEDPILVVWREPGWPGGYRPNRYSFPYRWRLSSGDGSTPGTHLCSNSSPLPLGRRSRPGAAARNADTVFEISRTAFDQAGMPIHAHQYDFPC